MGGISLLLSQLYGCQIIRIWMGGISLLLSQLYGCQSSGTMDTLKMQNKQLVVFHHLHFQLPVPSQHWKKSPPPKKCIFIVMQPQINAAIQGFKSWRFRDFKPCIVAFICGYITINMPFFGDFCQHCNGMGSHLKSFFPRTHQYFLFIGSVQQVSQTDRPSPLAAPLALHLALLAILCVLASRVFGLVLILVHTAFIGVIRICEEIQWLIKYLWVNE